MPVLKLTESQSSDIEDVVARESPITIILNNRELVTLLCSPADLRFLAVGFLFSEGLLETKGQIKRITVDDPRGVVRVETGGDEEIAGDALFKRFITSGCGRGASFYNAIDAQGQPKVESNIQVSVPQMLTLVSEFQRRSQVYRATGGVHSVALCDTGSIIIFTDDIGRHNAVDKILGRCVLDDIATNDRILITSGRVSSEIVLKVARRNVPIIASKSAPTDLGVRLANDLGLTLVGFVRGKRMNVYTHAGRIITDGN